MLLMAFLLILLIVLLHGVGRLRGDLLTRGTVKASLFPGLLPDSLARTFACLATATPVVGLSPWRDGAPFLIEGECPLKRIGVPLATVFRLGVLFCGFITVILMFPVAAQTVPDPDTLWRAFESGDGKLTSTLLSAPFSWLATGFYAWWTLALLAAMVLAAGLRADETLSALLVGGGFVGVLEGAHWLGLRFGVFSNGWFLQRFYEADAGRALVMLVMVTIAMVVLLAAMHGIPMLMQKIRPRPEGWHEGNLDRTLSGP